LRMEIQGSTGKDGSDLDCLPDFNFFLFATNFLQQGFNIYVWQILHLT